MNHTILIIDDDTLIVNTLKKRFDTYGMEVILATTSEEAKKALDKFEPEIVILDLLLTKADGSEGVLDYIKSKEKLKNISVLVLTNLDKPELKQLLLGQGVKEYLIKGSLTLDELYEKALGYLEPKKD